MTVRHNIPIIAFLIFSYPWLHAQSLQELSVALAEDKFFSPCSALKDRARLLGQAAVQKTKDPIAFLMFYRTYYRYANAQNDLLRNIESDIVFPQRRQRVYNSPDSTANAYAGLFNNACKALGDFEKLCQPPAVPSKPALCGQIDWDYLASNIGELDPKSAPSPEVALGYVREKIISPFEVPNFEKVFGWPAPFEKDAQWQSLKINHMGGPPVTFEEALLAYAPLKLATGALGSTTGYVRVLGFPQIPLWLEAQTASVGFVEFAQSEPLFFLRQQKQVRLFTHHYTDSLFFAVEAKTHWGLYAYTLGADGTVALLYPHDYCPGASAIVYGQSFAQGPGNFMMAKSQATQSLRLPLTGCNAAQKNEYYRFVPPLARQEQMVLLLCPGELDTERLQKALENAKGQLHERVGSALGTTIIDASAVKLTQQSTQISFESPNLTHGVLPIFLYFNIQD